MSSAQRRSDDELARIRASNVQPNALAAELVTGCSGHSFGSIYCKLPSTKKGPSALNRSRGGRPSSSSSSICPDQGSISSITHDASNQQKVGPWEDADAIPWRSRRRSSRKNIAKGASVAEPLAPVRVDLFEGKPVPIESLQSSSRHPGKSIVKNSSYRMETEYLPSSATHASFGFSNSNNIVLTQLPEKIKDGIRTIIEKGWELGIEKEGTCHDKERYFFKLKRKPFSSGNVYAVTRLSRNIIAYLACEGWMAQPVSSLLSPYDSLNFRKCSKPLPKCYWLALSYGYSGKWYLRDQLNVLGGADELIDTIRLTMQEMDLISQLKQERVAGDNNWHQFYLKGTFHRTGSWARKKIMFLRVMERLEERGWSIYVGYHRTYFGDSFDEKKVGTWICMKSREWTPKNPVKVSWAD
ncbi:hypothetical protein MFRU_004g03290 [Monilinia fructicola]|uniref:Uncharacterized protein n=1 Tax=Monilinia fructicola TaxID=38448 RepID=A0A5M9JLH8_MONFR|nr:hypothetical protein EYC84_001200 [Monilinia fructicola]KAG4033826.1 hypothetical protein MFRU_004g03290 [Monilinia fructicola]